MFPLGLLFKEETKTRELVDILRVIQDQYAPKGPDGVTDLLVGGDQLTEANSRNVQWAFAEGDSKEDRLEGLTLKFEDWHAIRVMFEIARIG